MTLVRGAETTTIVEKVYIVNRSETTHSARPPAGVPPTPSRPLLCATGQSAAAPLRAALPGTAEGSAMVPYAATRASRAGWRLPRGLFLRLLTCSLNIRDLSAAETTRGPSEHPH
eukprot:1514943-Pleurochrysis_carterae.AAC.1